VKTFKKWVKLTTFWTNSTSQPCLQSSENINRTYLRRITSVLFNNGLVWDLKKNSAWKQSTYFSPLSIQNVTNAWHHHARNLAADMQIPYYAIVFPLCCHCQMKENVWHFLMALARGFLCLSSCQSSFFTYFR